MNSTAATARTVLSAAIWMAVVWIGATDLVHAAETDLAAYRKSVQPLLARYCFDCHGADQQEANLAIDTLDANLAGGNAATVWSRIADKLSLRLMPPEDANQPSDAERQAIVDWVKSEMARGGLHYDDKLLMPAYGNFVPHEQLFGRPPAGPSWSPPRYWRIRPAAYDRLVGSLRQRASITNPFTLSGEGGFKDYAKIYDVDASGVQILLANANAVSEAMVRNKVENGRSNPEAWEAPPVLLPLCTAGPEQPTDQQVRSAIVWLYGSILARDPTADELRERETFFRAGAKKLGPGAATRNLVASVCLTPEVVFRYELGGGSPDAHGRVRLAPREIAFALAFAFSDDGPDRALRDAVAKGTLQTRDDVEREVRRMLADAKVPKPRILNFFREYFGYADAELVFKDKALNGNHMPQYLVQDTDRLVELILSEDKNVLEELLTTTRSFVNVVGWGKQEPHDSYSVPPDWKWSAGPVELPASQRAGILTQPSWLVARSGNFDNDIVKRGKWVRQKLLGGTIPDLPITVNAQVPDEPHNSLRERMRVTQEEYCWKCHRQMNPLGVAFEDFDHFGRFRVREQVQDPEKTAKNIDAKGKPLGPVMRDLPVDASGVIEGSGEPAIDGPVSGSAEMIRRLAKSERVRQVFVRHAFRYWMGRNETPVDAATLQAADAAYVRSGGSMRELIVSLLTSDSFLYRKHAEQTTRIESSQFENVASHPTKREP